MENRDIAINETIIFIARITGWSLEYICGLPLRKLHLLVKELQYQKALEDYYAARNFAMILTTWANSQSKGRKFRIEDFIGKPPERLKGGDNEQSGTGA